MGLTYAIAAAVPDQRPPAPVRGGNNLADEQHMIAGRMERVMPAFEPRRAAFDQRRARRPEAKCYAREAIGVRTGETPRQFDLIVSEDVHGVLLGAGEDRQASRSPGKAPDDKGRLERHRVERVGSESDESVRCPSSDDGDPGRELRQGVAEMALSDGGPLLAVDCRHCLVPRSLRRVRQGAAS